MTNTVGEPGALAVHEQAAAAADVHAGPRCRRRCARGAPTVHRRRRRAGPAAAGSSRGSDDTSRARQRKVERVLVLDVTSSTFTRDELADGIRAIRGDGRPRPPQTRNWDPWVDQYTDDIIYVEHAAGTMRGREQVRPWIWKTMETFPGSYMTSFPSLWKVYRRGDRPGASASSTTRCATPATARSSAPPTSRSSPTPATGCGVARKTSTTRCGSSPRR